MRRARVVRPRNDARFAVHALADLLEAERDPATVKAALLGTLASGALDPLGDAIRLGRARQ